MKWKCLMSLLIREGGLFTAGKEMYNSGNSDTIKIIS